MGWSARQIAGSPVEGGWVEAEFPIQRHVHETIPAPRSRDHLRAAGVVLSIRPQEARIPDMRSWGPSSIARAISLAIAVGILGGCSLTLNSDEFAEQGVPGEGRICDPGDTKTCICPPQDGGAQTCKEDGSGWGPCDCGDVGGGGEGVEPGEGEGEAEGEGGGEGEGEGGGEGEGEGELGLAPCDAVLVGRGDPEADSDDDGVPDGVECPLGLDPLDGREPGNEGWYEGFETESSPLDRWVAVTHNVPDCVARAVEPVKSGSASSLFDGTTDGCSANQYVGRPLPVGLRATVTLAAWFHDPGVATGEIRTSLANDSLEGFVTVGLHSSLVPDAYVMFQDGQGPLETRVARAVGWHLAVIRREESGRTYGYLDGVLLGSLTSDFTPTQVTAHVADLRAHYDDIVVYDAPYSPPMCYGTHVPSGWSCIPPTGPGGFLMGSPEDEVGRDNGEMEAEHQHVVVLTRPFMAMTSEVTQAEWEALMGAKEFEYEDCGATCPADSTSWLDAVAFGNALSKSRGLTECYLVDGESVTWPEGPDCEGYRLPTEAEWEYMARAGTSTPYHTGASEEALARAGWYQGNWDGSSHTVGGKEPNSWGLFDVHGNVWEFVWDHEGLYPEPGAGGELPGPVVDPVGPQDGEFRIQRGGAAGNLAYNCRSARRTFTSPNHRAASLGFRLVRTVR